MRTYKFLIQIIAHICLSMTLLPSCSLLSNEGDSIFDKNGNIIYDIQTDSRLTGIWANVYFGEKEEYSEDIEELEITSLIEFKKDGCYNSYYRQAPGTYDNGIIKGCSLEDFNMDISSYVTAENGLLTDLLGYYFFEKEYSITETDRLVLDYDDYINVFRKVNGFEDMILVKSINDEIFFEYDDMDRVILITDRSSGKDIKYHFYYGDSIVVTSEEDGTAPQWLCTLTEYDDRLIRSETGSSSTEYTYSEETGLLESIGSDSYRWDDSGNLVSGGNMLDATYLDMENKMNIDIYGDCPLYLRFSGLTSRDYMSSRICATETGKIRMTYDYEFNDSGAVTVMTVTTAAGETEDPYEVKTYRFSH